MNSNSKNNEERIVPLRLQKFLARAGIASRRGSENLMTAGRVRVNGEVVTELGSKVDPRVDKVEVDGKLVRYPHDPVTLMLHKPAGFITTMSDPYGRPCVASLIPTEEHPGLFPIGRLDADTTGLLLFTTDGELGNRLMHPRHHVRKTYEVLIEGKLFDGELDPLREGVELEDGMTQAAELTIVDSLSFLRHPSSSTAPAERSMADKTMVEISICEGRKRQVRRMFEAIGHPVAHLHRVRIGPIVLGTLSEGRWRMLSQEEQDSLAGAE